MGKSKGKERYEFEVGEEILKMKGITKRFPGVLANDSINFNLKAGEVHALLGENGAGKTTLMNILYGLYEPNKGKIEVYGKKRQIKSPKQAIKLGIGIVPQIFHQVQSQTVAENIALLSSDKILNMEKIKARIERLGEKYGWEINPEAKIWQLSASEKQKVEILKLLYQDANILILDEPTSILTPNEKKEIFSKIKRIKEEGKSIIFVTHKLDEALEISDRITVLRDGKKVITANSKELKKDKLVKLMFGKEVETVRKRGKGGQGETVLKAEGVKVLDDQGKRLVEDLSFELKKGEILGIAGIGGCGIKGIIEAIAGIRKVKSGKIEILGEDLTNASPKQLIDFGVRYIPEDRIGVALAPSLSLKDNLILRDYRKEKFSNFFLHEDKIKKKAKEKISEYNIKTPGLETPIKSLSGGNIQRGLLAREISEDLKILIASYPTYGLDVESANQVREQILELKEKDKSVIFASESLEELKRLSDRILVLSEGKKVDIVNPEISKEKLGRLMIGDVGN